MKIIDKRVICSNPDSVFNYFGWPTVTRLPDGALAMAASGFRMRHICPFGKGVICYSFDEGMSWTRPAVVTDTPLDDRDSGIAAFGGNRAIFTSFNNSIAAAARFERTDTRLYRPAFSHARERKTAGQHIQTQLRRWIYFRRNAPVTCNGSSRSHTAQKRRPYVCGQEVHRQ